MIGKEKKKAKRPRSPREELLEMLKRQREELEKIKPEERVRIPEPPPERWQCREVKLERAMRELGVEPMFPELFDLATTCPEVFDCYRKLSVLWEDAKSREVIFKAAWTGADIAKVVDLLWRGELEEAEKAARP
ncbi:hypothetical protein [Pyrobaculum ferrireducens]|uniref:Uncharacterized protein n=1 Tax=Pyrobaculum ferrireducens TaxID=1104324 RepID=G7VEY5_9CREN|nr:hypothetical protein [Pyrobaculum ferrireducens]AET34150.1 hypothetical protein P186_2774 [Pyrobaculum ferrireducens]